MEQYRRKTETVEAAQWSGSNWHSMLAWVRDQHDVHVSTSEHNGETLLLIHEEDETYTARPGAWVVRQDDRFLVWDDPTFRHVFEAAELGPTMLGLPETEAFPPREAT